MQNLNKKASILLWAVMLSLIVAISFISIASKINKSIKHSGKILEYRSEKIKLKSALNNQQNTQLSENKIIVFESNLQKVFSIKKSEKIIFNFSGSTDFNIDLGIVGGFGGTIFYNYTNNNISTSSGIINSSHSFSGTLSNNTGSLFIENIGGYSQILINSEIEFESTEKKYKIIQAIGNNTFIQTKGQIPNH